MIGDIFGHRSFVFANAWRETRTRYAGTAMGAFWHIVQPLFLILLFSVLFTGLFPSRPGSNAALHIMTGMLPWVVFADCLVRCTTSLTDNAHYLRKLPLPETLFVARTAVSAGLMMLLSLALAAMAAVAFGARPNWSWLTVPIAGLLMIGFAFGLGLILAPIHVLLRDTGQAIGVFSQFWMWLTPVVLTPEVMPGALRAAQPWNPAFWFVQAIREPLVSGQAAPIVTWIIMLSLVSATLLLGDRLIRRLRSDIRDLL